MRSHRERDPARWARELEAVEASGLRLVLVGEPGGWAGRVDVEGADRDVRVEYPIDWPARPPRLWELGSDDLGPAGRLHVFLDGALCLLGHDQEPDAWSSERTVVDVIARYRLFRSMVDRGELVDDHGGPAPEFAGATTALPLIVSPEHAADAVAEEALVEVQQQPDREVEEAHLRQRLRLVGR